MVGILEWRMMWRQLPHALFQKGLGRRRILFTHLRVAFLWNSGTQVHAHTHVCMQCKFSGDGGGGGGGDGGDGGGGSGGEECAQERDVYRKGEIEKNKFLGSGGDGGGGSRGDGGRLVGDEVVMIVVTSK